MIPVPDGNFHPDPLAHDGRPAVLYAPEPVLLAGASARAAAFSAFRAGHRIRAADLFADLDLQTVADGTLVDPFPCGVERWASRFENQIPLVYVGGLENSPGLLDRIAATRPVFGTTGEVLRCVRTPERLAALFDAAGIPRPQLAEPVVLDRRAGDSCRWLLKPRSSAGGIGISHWSDSQTSRRGNDAPVNLDEFVLQEFIEGTPGSAAFLAGDGFVELLGVTTMLSPDDEIKRLGRPFVYCGSITVDEQDTNPLERIGRCMAAAGLRGVFGVDFLRRKSPRGTDFLPIEVNPRYTAGMEVLERRDGRSYLGEHMAVWRGLHSERPRNSQDPSKCHGKKIIYARQRCIVGPLPVPTHAQILPTPPRFEVADISPPGTLIPAGVPICTVFARGSDFAECRDRLDSLERHVASICVPAS